MQSYHNTAILVHMDNKNPINTTYASRVGINHACRITGKVKSRIYSDLKSGKLSWVVEEDGKKTLNISDLDRLYKLAPIPSAAPVPVVEQAVEPIAPTMPDSIRLAVLEQDNARLEAQLQQQSVIIDRLQTSHDSLLQRLLPPAPIPVVQARRYWWERKRGL